MAACSAAWLPRRERALVDQVKLRARARTRQCRVDGFLERTFPRVTRMCVCVSAPITSAGMSPVRGEFSVNPKPLKTNCYAPVCARLQGIWPLAFPVLVRRVGGGDTHVRDMRFHAVARACARPLRARCVTIPTRPLSWCTAGDTNCDCNALCSAL